MFLFWESLPEEEQSKTGRKPEFVPVDKQGEAVGGGLDGANVEQENDAGRGWGWLGGTAGGAEEGGAAGGAPDDDDAIVAAALAPDAGKKKRPKSMRGEHDLHGMIEDGGAGTDESTESIGKDKVKPKVVLTQKEINDQREREVFEAKMRDTFLELLALEDFLEGGGAAGVTREVKHATEAVMSEKLDEVETGLEKWRDRYFGADDLSSKGNFFGLFGPESEREDDGGKKVTNSAGGPRDEPVARTVPAAENKLPKTHVVALLFPGAGLLSKPMSATHVPDTHPALQRSAKLLLKSKNWKHGPETVLQRCPKLGHALHTFADVLQTIYYLRVEDRVFVHLNALLSRVEQFPVEGGGKVYVSGILSPIRLPHHSCYGF